MQSHSIVVIGNAGAGKSTWIASVSEIPVMQPAQDQPRMDFGKIILPGENYIHFFGAPHQPKFDFMWEILAEGMRGFIALVDSTNAASFAATAHQIQTFRGYVPTLPSVVVANKQDLPDALSPDAVREALQIPPDIPVLPCVATEKTSAMQIFEVLWELIQQEK